MKKVAEEIYKRLNNNIYDQEGDRWWDEDFSLNLIKTILNPVRVSYSKKIINRLKINPEEKTALEVGCGGGFLCEEIAAIGFRTFGIDPARESIKRALKHSSETGLYINYSTGSGEDLQFRDNTFDTVFCCDVLEHVKDIPKVISEISRVLKPCGIFIYDTFNRNVLSNFMAIKILQEWERWAILPDGLHVWEMFIKPKEMKFLLKKNNLDWQEHIGIEPDISYLKMLRILHKRVVGELNYKEFGDKFRMVEGKRTQVIYMGYAVKLDRVDISVDCRM